MLRKKQSRKFLEGWGFKHPEGILVSEEEAAFDEMMEDIVGEGRSRREEREEMIEEEGRAEEVKIERKTPQSSLRDIRRKKVAAPRKKD